MKGEAIAQLMTMLVLKRANVPLKRDIIFLATADEEIGAGVGAAWIVKEQADLVRNAEFLLNEGGDIRADARGDVEYYGIATTEKSPFWLGRHGAWDRGPRLAADAGQSRAPAGARARQDRRVAHAAGRDADR